MLRRAWWLLRETVEGYIADEAMSRGAAIAFYTIFAIAPLLVIATAIAGLAIGEQAAQGAIAEQLRGELGADAADAVLALVQSAAHPRSGQIAAIIGVATLLLTASAAFGEVQAALDAIWRSAPQAGSTMLILLRARLAAFILVAASGLLLLGATIVSTAVAAVATWAAGLLPFRADLVSLANFGVSFVVATVLFATMYKVLPHRRLRWRDVGVGAAVTGLLFTVGKSLIGWYLGSAAVASAYGAAGALLVVMLWIYWSAQIFLLGAEFTRVWAGLQGNPEAAAAAAAHTPRPPRKRAGFGASVLGGAALAAAVMALIRRR